MAKIISSLQFLGSHVWWPYIQSVINMDCIHGCIMLYRGYVEYSYLFNDGLTCMLMLLLCRPGMYRV